MPISSVISEEMINALPQTGGSREFAMGGTYIAFNQGINALFGNPAGLPDNNTFEIILGNYWQIYKTSQFDDEYYLRSWSDSYSIKYEKIHRLNYFGLSYHKRLPHSPFKFAGAIGFSPFYNWKSTRQSNGNESYISGTSEDIRYSIVEKEKIVGLYDLLSIGIGFSWKETGSIGISVNYPVRKQYEYEFNSIYTFERNGDQQSSDYTSKNSEDVSASQFVRIGGMLHLTSRLTLGILWMQAHHYNISDQRREFPATLNFGIAYKILPELLSAFDIQSQPWEKVKIENEFIPDTKSGNAYRFGLEYINKIIFRTGYALDRLPVMDADDNAVDMNNITLGIGYLTKYFIFEIGARYRFASFKTDEWLNVYDYNFREIVLQSTIKIII